MKKVLITGISGFAGSFLAEHLVSSSNYELYGTYNSESSLKNLSSIKDQLTIFKVNLLSYEAVKKMVQTTKPDLIYHLAAIASPGDSFDRPSETIISNTTMQLNLLEALKEEELSPKILIVSSAHVYGPVKKEDLPIDEKTDLKPNSPYAVSKIAQDFLGLQYFLAYNMHVVRVRPFNHIGPKQSPHFAVSSFAKKIAEIEKGKYEPVLHVGNIESKRDLTDVRDTVRAYHLVLEKGTQGDVYNVGSNRSKKMSEVLDILLSFAKVPITIKIDESLLRPSDSPDLICDNTKLIHATGWNPQISLEISLKDTLEYFRSMVQ